MAEDGPITVGGKILHDLRVIDLKKELEKRGLSKSGSKHELVKRLKAVIIQLIYVQIGLVVSENWGECLHLGPQADGRNTPKQLMWRFRKRLNVLVDICWNEATKVSFADQCIFTFYSYLSV